MIKMRKNSLDFDLQNYKVTVFYKYVFWQILQLVVVQEPVNEWRNLVCVVSAQPHYWYKGIIIIINIFKWLEMFLVRSHVADTATYLYFQLNLSILLFSVAFRA